MEDESLFAAEKLSICDSGRSPKRYGSTCNHVRNNGHLVRHELGKTDTLQGIALKYGCTVCSTWFENKILRVHIVRYNKLFIFTLFFLFTFVFSTFKYLSNSKSYSKKMRKYHKNNIHNREQNNSQACSLI